MKAPKRLINRDRSIIPACDVPLDLFEKIVKETADIDGIGGYKVGFVLGLTYGLPKIVEITRRYTDKPVIYDHQKACTDIPDTGVKFVKTCKDAGIDSIILFPQSGPVTEKAWIKASQDEGMAVIVGGLMSHDGYVKSEGGYLADESIMEMYMVAAELGVTDFVVPGNKPADIKRIRSNLENNGVTPIFYSPGFLAQKGDIKEAQDVGGKYWHSIVGRGIYQSDDIKDAALKLTKLL